jgi:hypothetical protein
MRAFFLMSFPRRFDRVVTTAWLSSQASENKHRN